MTNSAKKYKVRFGHTVEGFEREDQYTVFAVLDEDDPAVAEWGGRYLIKDSSGWMRVLPNLNDFVEFKRIDNPLKVAECLRSYGLIDVIGYKATRARRSITTSIFWSADVMRTPVYYQMHSNGPVAVFINDNGNEVRINLNSLAAGSYEKIRDFSLSIT